jgi:hypothetical protein
MTDGYALAVGSIYQGGSWNHDDNIDTPEVPAIFKSTNEGSTWDRKALSDKRGYIYSITVHSNQKQNVLAAGRQQNVSGNWEACVFRSTDSGGSWIAVNAPTSSSISELIMDPHDPDTWYAATENGISIHKSNLNTWSAPNPSIMTTCIIADPNVQGRLFVGSNQGVYISTDSGTSWETLNDGLIIQTVNCLGYDEIHDVLYAGTEGGGVYRYADVTSVEQDDPANMPSDFTLYQNYPNPFNATTLIQYRVHNSAPIELAIFDIQGRMIRMLEQGSMESGLNKINWDGRNDSGFESPSGIYILRLRSGSRFINRKMIYQK